jgi:hypothetical protein
MVSVPKFCTERAQQQGFLARRQLWRLLNLKTKEGAHLGSEDVAEESSYEPNPAMQAAGGDSGEVSADVTAIGQACSVTEKQSTYDRRNR